MSTKEPTSSTPWNPRSTCELFTGTSSGIYSRAQISRSKPCTVDTTSGRSKAPRASRSGWRGNHDYHFGTEVRRQGFDPGRGTAARHRRSADGGLDERGIASANPRHEVDLVLEPV